jgi:hypothetical protein
MVNFSGPLIQDDRAQTQFRWQIGHISHISPPDFRNTIFFFPALSHTPIMLANCQAQAQLGLDTSCGCANLGIYSTAM